MNMKGRGDVPVVLAVFGSTKSKAVYSQLVNEICQGLSTRDVILAFSSRIVQVLEEKRGTCHVPPSPAQAIEILSREGYKWAVVQSVHLLAGHEFYRLVGQTRGLPVRTSIGLPLFWSRHDYLIIADILMDYYKRMAALDEAVVFIGHGTDHASWSTYSALEHILRLKGIERCWVGVVDGQPGALEVAKEVAASSMGKAIFIPLMLVSGVHVLEDIQNKKEDTWSGIFKQMGISTRTVEKGLLELKGVRELFLEHIQVAMDAIPLQVN